MGDQSTSQGTLANLPILNPTCMLWISAYHGFSTSIAVLNLTEKLLPEYVENNWGVDDSTFRNRLHDAVTQSKRKDREHPDNIMYFLKKDKWKSRVYYLVPVQPTCPERIPGITKDPEAGASNASVVDDYIATIRRTSYLTTSYLMEFPDDSQHSSHSIEVKCGTLVPRTQIFVKESTQYSWEMESGIKDFRQTLVKMQCGQRTPVALFRRLEQLRGLRGKLLLVDETAGVDHVVVLLSTIGTYKGGGG